MSPELELLLQTMHTDIKETRDRVQTIETRLASQDGAKSITVARSGRWHKTGQTVLAAMTGALAAGGLRHFWPS